jgi:polyhydroxybutyrate depolymerase
MLLGIIDNKALHQLLWHPMKLKLFVICAILCFNLSACGGGANSIGSSNSSPSSGLPSSQNGMTGEFTKSIVVAGVTRNYIFHVPASYKASTSIPVVVLLHGGNGSAATIGNITSTNGGFNGLSEAKGFIAVYPDSLSGNWDDGRESIPNKTNDVAFVAAALDAIGLDYNVNTNKVYVAGISNGGMMSQRLACELPDRFAAVAVVAANMPTALANVCNLGQAIPITFFSGDADPLMPFNGGVVRGTIGGNVLSASASVNFWATRNGARFASSQALPNPDTLDGTTTQLDTYKAASRGDVLFYKIAGGGHSWPSGTQYASAALIGAVAKDFNANETIWAFFAANGR